MNNNENIIASLSTTITTDELPKRKAGRPRLTEEPLCVKTVRFPLEVWDTITRAAKTNNITVSQLIREGTDFVIGKYSKSE